jgi:NADH-quinone oxidoreductase subunit B
MLESFKKRARAYSLHYFMIHTGCCADEFVQTIGCRYDLERFGCVEAPTPAQADLLVIQGALTERLAPEVKKIFEQMPSARAVLALGACACTGGLFTESPGILPADQIVPVDVFVPGCPPRPEAIMHGVITLQDKIRGMQRASPKMRSIRV